MSDKAALILAFGIVFGAIVNGGLSILAGGIYEPSKLNGYIVLNKFSGKLVRETITEIPQPISDIANVSCIKSDPFCGTPTLDKIGQEQSASPSKNASP